MTDYLPTWLDEPYPLDHGSNLAKRPRRPDRERGRAMSEIYDRTCTTCGHTINDHDANECWNYEAHGKQCDCPWMEINDDE